MKKTRLISVVCACILAFTAIPAVSSVIYTYTGTQFNEFSQPTLYDNTMEVTGFIELDSPLLANMSLDIIEPLSYSFDDGLNTITNSNEFNSSFAFSTDNIGEITGWGVTIQRFDPTNITGSYLRIFISTFHVPESLLSQDVASMDECSSPYVSDVIACNPQTLRDGRVIDMPGVWSGPTVIPITPAVWLFGSGLIGLIGVARRKKV